MVRTSLTGWWRKDFEEIVVLDNFTRGRRQNLDTAIASGKVTIVEGDIRDAKSRPAAMDGIDIVFHEAAIRITHCAENPRLAHDVLATGTFNVLEAAVNAKVKRVVSASSASIYGQAEEFPTSENHHGYGNRTIYGATKSYSEGLLRSFYEMYGLNYVALRYFNVYGPRMDAFGVYTEVMIRWMERLAKDSLPDPRRRRSDDGLRLRHRHRPSEFCGQPIRRSPTTCSISPAGPKPASPNWPPHSAA